MSDYFYTRTSTIDQHGQRFNTDGFDKDKIFFDKGISGTNSFFERPKAKELISLIRKNKVTSITIPELDRLGRNTTDLLTVLEFCTKHKVNLKIKGLPESLNEDGTENLYFEMVFTCIGAVAKMELRLRKERTAHGIAKYKEKHGTWGGRKIGAVETKEAFLSKPANVKVADLLKNSNLSLRKIASICNTSLSNVQKVKKVLKD